MEVAILLNRKLGGFAWKVCFRRAPLNFVDNFVGVDRQIF